MRATARPVLARRASAVVEALEPRRLLSGDGLQAAYYASPDFTGPSVSRVDPVVNFNWKHAGPAAGTRPNLMSVRWTGQIVSAATAKYTFYAASQGGLKLYVGGHVLINDWKNHHTRTDRTSLTLAANQKYDIELDYHGGKFPALVSLSWFHRGKGQRKSVIPTSQLYSGTPAPASDLLANQILPTQTSLAWQDQSDNTTGFRIERSVDGVSFTALATLPASASSYSDTAAPQGRHAIYRVVATNNSGDSAATVVALIPPAPADPVGLDAAGVSGNEIDLTWQDPTGYAAAYQIERSSGDGRTFVPLASVAAPTTRYSDTTLSPGTIYAYRVTAVNDAATSSATYPILANTLSGFVQTNHPTPALLGASGGWQFSTPSDAVTVDTGHAGNIFYQGEPVSFILGGTTSTYEVRDYSGNLVASGPAAHAITLSLSRLGWYKIYLYGSTSSSTFGDAVGGTTFCILRDDPNFPQASQFAADNVYFAPAFTRVDPQVNFTWAAWGLNPPDPSLPDAYGVRWTGQIAPPTSGTYTFSLLSADGARLWVNGQLIIDHWQPHGAATDTGAIALQAGARYDLRLDYYHVPFQRVCVLSWSDGHTVSGVVPQIALYSSAAAVTADGVAATYFAPVLQNDPNGDTVVRDTIAIGPERYAADASNPAASIGQLDAAISYDSQNYTPLDPQRNRALFIAFSGGTENYLGGVTQVVQHFQNQVKYWEPQNEPNGAYTNGADFVPIMRDFYNTVKAVNPNLKVIGPGVVTVGPYGLAWLQEFFAAGGGQYLDAFSFHAYNNVNRDLTLARESLNGLKNLLTQYGLANIPIWQTEQGYMAAVYGAYEPQNQGEWTMLEQMVFEQYGIPKEHNYYWYDVSHGYWDEPMFWENEHGLNPAAPLMAVWAQEVYGTNFSHAYDFGPDGNNTYIGSLCSGPGKNVAVFMTGGATDGQVNLNVIGGGSTLRVVDAFGNAADVAIVNGQATIDVPILPVYVELGAGQTITVIPVNWGPDLATQAGVTASASGTNVDPVDPAIPDSINKIHDGVLQNWYYSQQPIDNPWIDNTPAGSQTWVEIDLASPASIGHVVVRAPTPWQWDGAPLDYDLQYFSNGQWVTIQHVQEEPKTFAVFSPESSTTVDSYYSERSIFTHTFTPVMTSRIRLLVNQQTWGGGATELVSEAGGQAGQNQLTLQEIEVYGA